MTLSTILIVAIILIVAAMYLPFLLYMCSYYISIGKHWGKNYVDEKIKANNKQNF